MNRTPYNRRSPNLTREQQKAFKSIHRSLISIGVQLESLMVEVGQLQPDRRQVLTRERLELLQFDNRVTESL